MRQISGQRSARPERLGLLEQVRVLAAGHLVAIDVGRAGHHAGFERRVELADGFPVVGDRLQRFEVEPGVARR